MKISICIPTYNRARHLENCLNSIILCGAQSDLKFQVCVSDNCSTDNTEEVVRKAQSSIDVKYKKNTNNIGIARNILNVAAMAEGDFIWLIGDDDLLMPNAIIEIDSLFELHPNVDFFYVNSFHLNTEYVEKFSSPFDTANLPSNMLPFSQWPIAGEMKFIDLINPKISFDFLGGIFLSVFRRKNWDDNVGVLDEMAMSDARAFSYLDNTFPHVKIFARAFSTSKAYFNTKPLNVCLTGVREWSVMYPFIHSVRLVEALGEYRKNGLPYLRYIRCRNYALNHFMPDFANMLLDKNNSGYRYINPFTLILENCMYPNFYLSAIWFFGRRLRKLVFGFFSRLFGR